MNATVSSKVKEFALREASAYLIGQTEERIRTFCEQHDLSFTEIAIRVSLALAITGEGTDLLLSKMRGQATDEPQVLQPEVALARRPRKPVPASNAKKYKRMNGNRKNAIRKALKDGLSINGTAKKFKTTWAAVKKVLTEKAA